MDEKIRERVITGTKQPNIKSADDIKDVFEQLALNFLEISRTPLTTFPESLGRLVQLTSLSLHHNQLQQLPSSLGKLVKLKNFDVSNNQLESLPEWSALTCLESINVSCNKLTCLPDVTTLTRLHVLNASSNCLASLPDGLFHEDLSLLADVYAENNQIVDLVSQVGQAKSLKSLILNNNCLETLPLEICELHKLKQVGLKDNKFKDKKLQRLCASGQVKQICEHVRKTVKSSAAATPSDAKSKHSKKQRQKSRNDEEQVPDVIRVVNVDERLAVTASENVSDVRPYIVCCVVRDVNLESPALFKKFISVQVSNFS